MLEDSRLAEDGNDTSDPFEMLLDEELAGEKEEESGGRLERVLAGSGVVHHHANKSVVGPSRVEQHISACAAKDVGGSGGAAHLPAAVCDLLQPTQANRRGQKYCLFAKKNS